eukprot:TRINITY_DN2044_c0_g1_i1.p1 TRINITY_DN2044_c0_g1~~TRINITY_DN2044_c0_g1_i1.p1  ORF type:complete len:281 (+),score=70.93 TRINITY_DN2044_c0_g1_i1:51-893(+)
MDRESDDAYRVYYSQHFRKGDQAVRESSSVFPRARVDDPSVMTSESRSSYVEKLVGKEESSVDTKKMALQLQESSLPWVKGKKSEKISSLYQDSFSSKAPSRVEEGRDLEEIRERKQELQKSHIFGGKEWEPASSAKSDFTWRCAEVQKAAFSSQDFQTSHVRLAHSRKREFDSTYSKSFVPAAPDARSERTVTRKGMQESHIAFARPGAHRFEGKTEQQDQFGGDKEHVERTERMHSAVDMQKSSIAFGKDREIETMHKSSFLDPMKVFAEERRKGRRY